MKRIINSALSLALIIILLLMLVACGDSAEKTSSTTEAPEASVSQTSSSSETPETQTNSTDDDANSVEKTGVWKNATYLKDSTFGEGSKTLTVEVKAENQSVKFTIKTDKDTVGAALLEHNLIAGDEGAYGLYVKIVNGMTADYDVDQSYWAFYINGEYALTGVDTTEIKEGEAYKLEYTK